jgi:DNA-directed RNA polymerase specialized sigma24 family protein
MSDFKIVHVPKYKDPSYATRKQERIKQRKLLRRRKRISDEAADAVLKLYVAGVPIAEIVKITGHSTGTIYQIAHSSGMKLRRRLNATFN